jgi:hypothetical protein
MADEEETVGEQDIKDKKSLEEEPAVEKESEDEDKPEDEGVPVKRDDAEDERPEEEMEPKGEEETKSKDTFECKMPEDKSISKKIIHFFIPWIIAIFEIFLLYLLLPRKIFITLGFWMMVYFFPPFGKETVIPFGMSGKDISAAVPFFDPETLAQLDPLLIALAIASIDIIVGLFLVWNFDYAKRIPLLGKFICKLENKGGDLLSKNRFIDTLSFVGVTLFVIVPFQGSGAVGASIIGRSIGMNPYKVWGAIILGAISGCLLIAYAFNTFKVIFVNNRILGVLILVAIFVVIFIYFIRKRKNNVTKGECENEAEK